MSSQCVTCQGNLIVENEIICDFCRGSVHTTCSGLSKREKRKNNIIIFKLPELESGGRDEQLASDKESIQTILGTLELVLNCRSWNLEVETSNLLLIRNQSKPFLEPWN
ncbi:hypothetical protein QE152_g37384 [Popillia japonica]|uniref:Phorbol-ester/DAG-type domain-containing protein n=1 Tax=Popillia japonica TaxID=7064 RepID=A0AAW1IAH6_POPJA